MHGITKIPKQLGAHRVAAIALYRALLSQCTKLPIEETTIEGLKNAIRNRFRIARPQRLRLALAFKSGYTALDILDASVAGDEASTTRIKDLYSRMPDQLKQPPPPPKHLIAKPKNEAHYPPPDQYKLENMFPRPLGSVKGIRKAPFLVNAGGLPFIRWKKPQAENVSRVIKSKIATSQRRLDKLAEIDTDLRPLASWEDVWDQHVARLETEEKGNVSVVGEPLWVYEVEVAAREVERLRSVAQRKAVQMSKRFTAIVLKERELVQIEREQRRAAGKAKWLEKMKSEGNSVS